MKFIKQLVFTFILAVSGTMAFGQKPAEVKLFAHRAGAHEYDENTLSAFKSSYENGLRGFETDIRLTKDGELVIFHDANMERIIGKKGAIEELTSAEIRQLKTKKGNPIMFVNELLDFMKDKDGVYIEFEMKTNNPMYDEATLHAYCDKLYKSAMAKRPANSDYVFTSFDKRPLQYLKKQYPGVDLLFIKGEGLTDKVLEELKELQITRIGCRIEGTTRSMVQKAQKDGIVVSLWPGHTVNDFILGVTLGANYLCSDVPVEVQKYVTKNLPWIKLK